MDRTLRVRGVVQGVGYRPWVARQAMAAGLRGWVCNDGAGVLLRITGPAAAVAGMIAVLGHSGPPAATVLAIENLPPQDPPPGEDFRILASAGGPISTLPPVDLATCPACLAELHTPGNRRHRHPFTSCADCGPRWSLMTALPYDRARTTMAGFPMCEACAAEYADPGNRRFHAEPLSCPQCGPQLSWHGNPPAMGEDALQAALTALRAGAIVALKGLGGFQLCCLASPPVVARLRLRKQRPWKPFAVMTRDPEALAVLDDVERNALNSPAAPIVLCRSRAGILPREVAPGLDRVGIMLPATPLHHLILDGLGVPIICTSGNRSEEPICISGAEAVERLAGIADGILDHNRPIARSLDDGVVQVVDGAVQVLRRGRGLTPMALPLTSDGPTVLACGAHLKAAPALATGRVLVVGAHVGDLDHPLADAAMRNALTDLTTLFACIPERVACDLHGDLGGTRIAEESGLVVRRIQHHHAHAAAALAEHGLHGPALAVCWDGYGLGTDGSAWGGEFLVVEGTRMERVAHLRPFPLLGGDAAAREPSRVGLALLTEAGVPLLESAPALACGERAHDFLRLLGSAPRTTSAGRLFDGCAAIAGVCQQQTDEGQAAQLYEAAALRHGEAEPWPMPLDNGELDWRPMIRAGAADRDIQRSAARIHATLARGILDVTRVHPELPVLLTGGCFVNVLLTNLVLRGLGAAGRQVFIHRRLPPGDGGLSAGQAWLVRQEGL